jgi:hypothetical protein
MRPSGMMPKFDGITREGVECEEGRRYLFALYHGICQGCGESLDINNFTVAHCIEDGKLGRRLYGKWVVNSLANKRPTHRGACNDKVLCTRNPAKCAEIVEAARIEKEAKR